MASLQQVLDVDHPELGSYIRVLSVIFPSTDDTVHQGLDRILWRCTQVIELTVGCDVTHAVCVDWDPELPKDTRLALESLIQSPTCKSLLSYGFRFPISIFLDPQRTCGIQSLAFSKRGVVSIRGFVDQANDLPVQGLPYTALRSLSARPALIQAFLSACFQDGQNLFDFTNLDTLWVDHTSWRSTQTHLTLQMMDRAPSLRTLGLELDCECPTSVLSNSGLLFSQLKLTMWSGIFSRVRRRASPRP